jgi:hypothetical protein
MSSRIGRDFVWRNVAARDSGCPGEIRAQFRTTVECRPASPWLDTGRKFVLQKNIAVNEPNMRPRSSPVCDS